MCRSRQRVGGDGLADGFNVGVACKLEFDLADTGQIDLQLGVQIKQAGGFQRKGADLAVRDGRVVLLFAGQALHVNGDDALVGEYDAVAHALVCADDDLAVDQKVVDDRAEFGVLDLLQSREKTLAVEIDHALIPP